MKRLYFLMTLVLAVVTAWFMIEAKAFAGYMGPGLSYNDNNSNLPVGRYNSLNNYKVLMSFRANHSGNLTKFRTYWRSGAGYAKGTCGTIRVRVWPSDGGAVPKPVRTGTPLSQGQVRFSCSSGGVQPLPTCFQWVPLTASAPLTANSLYFIEMDNVDPNSSANWISVNAMCSLTRHGTAFPHMNNAADWALYYEDSSIHNVSSATYSALYTGLYHFPSAEVVYADGFSQGTIRLEPGNYSSYPYTINSSSKVRERFNIKATTQITGVEIHASASVAGSMKVSFYKNNVLVASGTVSESPAAFTTTSPNSNGVYSWKTVNLTSDKYFTVNNGDTLDIEMTGVGSSVWKMSADRTGVGAFEVSATSMGTNSSAQYWNGSSWVNTLYFNHNCTSCAFATSHFRTILKTGTGSTTPTTPTNPPPASPTAPTAPGQLTIVK